MIPLRILTTLVLATGFAFAADVPAKPVPIESGKPWYFAVSGDSRNCGDVVMPAIAQGAARDHAQFYWHLGDLRAIYDFDEDMLQQSKMKNRHLSISDYERTAWDDFRANQVAPFGEIPFFLGIGNHETVSPFKTRAEFITKFSDLLDTPVLRRQRLSDDSAALQPRSYFHWMKDKIEFIYLDNATSDQFDAEQMKWFENVIKASASNDDIRTVVVGTHDALPYSISCDHSMNESTEGTRTGVLVYQKLLDLQNKSHKRVYVLSSHSHFFMEGIYNTRYWRANGGVLPGWIVGTGGAQRYRLPANKADAKTSAEDTYGYLLGTVHPDGKIDFVFRPVEEGDVPAEINTRYTPEFVRDTCFAGNRRLERSPFPAFCSAVAEPVGGTQ